MTDNSSLAGSSHRDGYIVPIDGLRALAVLLVLMFHADLPYSSGGFIGVDVFFVISGFLITKNILKDVGRGSFSFSAFYLRRVARLFPALFLVILLTLCAAFFFMSPDDLARLGRVSILSTLSVGNIFFWLEAGYFDASAATKPLLHTWSLSVEEQFYLCWPLALVLLMKVSRNFAILGVAILGLCSLAAALFVSQFDSASTFFLMPFRIYQFALGAAVAFAGLSLDWRVSNPLFVFGTLAIVFVGCFADEHSAYWILSFVPALSAAFILFSCQSALAIRIFGAKIPVWLGSRSYSIYLVHWPIIVLWKMATDFDFSLYESLLAIGLSILAGELLCRMVEVPFRSRAGQSRLFRGAVLAGVVGVAATVLTLGAHYWGMKGYPDRVPEKLLAAASNLGVKWESRQVYLRNDVCNITSDGAVAASYDVAVCSNPPSGRPAFLVVGDSFAADAYIIFTKAYPDYYFGQATVPGCRLAIPKQLTAPKVAECRKIYEQAIFKLSRNPNYDGIIFSSNWVEGHYYRIDELIRVMEGAGKKVIVIGQRVTFKERVPALVSTSINEKSLVRRATQLKSLQEGMVNDNILERFSDRAFIVDLYNIQCDEECPVLDDEGNLLYLDQVHISLEGGEYFAKKVKQIYPTL